MLVYIFLLIALTEVCLVLSFSNRMVTPSRLVQNVNKFHLNMNSMEDKLDFWNREKLNKIESVKINSNYLRDPLQEEMKNEEIFVSHDAVICLKYHGSYQQDNRDLRKRGEQKKYSFMLRLKCPAGEIPPHLHKTLDDLCDKYGQQDLRITTRQAWQLHSVLKGDLGTVIKTINDVGSSTIGACGDVSRNVMTSPAPLATAEYKYMRTWAQVMAQLFKPMAPALTQIWEGEKSDATKVASMEYWEKELQDQGFDIQKEMLKDTGKGIIIPDATEPIYGDKYLPKKFKMAVTVPGDNSLDLYINDIGLVVIVDEKTQELEGFNVVVGGGMGRTHNKEQTFARAADHLGFVPKENIMEVCKAILAAQRDHGNREIRANARMKYLVHTLGIDDFRSLVETYLEDDMKIQPWRDMIAWEYKDWMGWHEQGDGNLFLGINIVQGRLRDFDDGPKYKTAVRKIIDEFGLTTVLTPTQSLLFKDVPVFAKARINAILKENSVPQIEEIDPLTRLSIACPAMPMCGLAVTEAERRMPEFVEMTRELLDELHINGDDMMMRMTGCPNGCARPYMAELALVGDGPDMYQIWLGGSPNLEERTGYALKDRVKYANMKDFLRPIFTFWRDNRYENEAFGDFCYRMGPDEVGRLSDIIRDGLVVGENIMKIGTEINEMKSQLESFDEKLANMQKLLTSSS